MCDLEPFSKIQSHIYVKQYLSLADLRWQGGIGPQNYLLPKRYKQYPLQKVYFYALQHTITL